VSSPSRSRLPVALSAFALYAFHHLFNGLAIVVIPWLLELGERSPRLAALGWLALFTTPVTLVGVAHYLGHALLDVFDRAGATRDPNPGVSSLWAGLFAWFAMSFSSLVSALLLFAIFPPPVEEGMAAAFVRVLEDARLEIGTHAVLWVVVAASLFAVERRVMRRAGRTAGEP
jgi:hypothetical protein